MVIVCAYSGNFFYHPHPDPPPSRWRERGFAKPTVEREGASGFSEPQDEEGVNGFGKPTPYRNGIYRKRSIFGLKIHPNVRAFNQETGFTPGWISSCGLCFLETESITVRDG
jgi:hypothetical protein